MNVEESCGAIIWKRVNGIVYFLALHRSDENVWEPPKGHRKPGETEQQTAQRELAEELGIQHPCFFPRFKEVLEYTSSKGVLLRYVFFLVNASEINLSREHDRFLWVPLEHIPRYFKHEDIQTIFKKAAEVISSQ